VKISQKVTDRKEAFRKLGEAISRQKGPTLFNPHYEIAGRAIQDRQVSHPVGPKMKSLQWESTGRRPK
jgi:hypothetical protein